jgi:hypothetical protein
MKTDTPLVRRVIIERDGVCLSNSVVRPERPDVVRETFREFPFAHSIAFDRSGVALITVY